MIIRNVNNLIGDYLGTVPAMQLIAERNAAIGLPCTFIVPDGIASLHKMAGLQRSDSNYADCSFDLHRAFALADKENLYMSQAHFSFVGLPTPSEPPRPQLNVPVFGVQSFDYILAPFSRSLPPEQLWPRQCWQGLVNSMPDKSFCLFGAGKDDIDFIDAPNCTPVFDASFDIVCNVMRAAKGGVISIVTGISHLAFALNVKNYLLINQGSWGRNPDAICITKPIHSTGVDDVRKLICQ